jgi:uncharacterized protein YqeY
MKIKLASFVVLLIILQACISFKLRESVGVDNVSRSANDLLGDEQNFIKVARATFDSIDLDKSGQIDANELEKVMTQIAADIGTNPPSKEDVKAVLDKVDTDKNGKIDFEEFKALAKDLLQSL